MNLRNRPGRIAAAVGAVIAGATTMTVVVAGAASADEPGRCVQNVNVREKPDAGSRIVALCEAGTKVKLGETRDGFVRIKELRGWAAEDYVKADDPSAASESSSEPASGDGNRSAREESDGGSGRSESGRSSHGDDDSGSDGAPDEVDDIEGLLG
jgi:hypothetical protein